MKNSEQTQKSRKFPVKALCRAGVIAALYVALVFWLQPFSFGVIQFRVSEALTVLPLLFPEAVPALFVGCLISNIMGNGVPDIVIGSLATLLAATGTYFMGKIFKNKFLKFITGGFFPVLLNAIAVPIILILCRANEHAYIIEALIIGAEEAISVYGIGAAVYFPLEKVFGRGKLLDSENSDENNDNR